MHSRIFGIVERDYYDNNKDNFDWELDYDDSLPGFADYIDHDTDINQDFKWLVECLINKTDRSLIEVDNNVLTIKFKPGFKEAYFREKWDALINTLVGSPDSFEQFCGIKPTDFAYRCKNFSMKSMSSILLMSIAITLHLMSSFVMSNMIQNILYLTVLIIIINRRNKHELYY